MLRGNRRTGGDRGRHDANLENSTNFPAPMIRVVTFDAAGTLIRLVQLPGTVYADAARRFGYALDPVRIQNAFKIVWRSLPQPPETKGPRSDDDREWWRDLVAQTMKEASYRIDPFDDYFETVYARFELPGVWELFPDIAGILAALCRAGIRLGIISNFDRRLYVILAQLKVLDHFEHLIISSEIGIRKPTTRIFEVAVHRFGVPAGEILHIGDEPDSDFAGARRAGLQAFLVSDSRTNLAKEIALRCGVA
jgi:putative hydrolase of the HAD superfamily